MGIGNRERQKRGISAFALDLPIPHSRLPIPGLHSYEWRVKPRPVPG
ncbi:hypothetical protein LG3211_4953 [Lysobacter gummosus]|nr:hypothetical protein LG3211_4953 [Lysobacter gummosus]